MKENNKSPKAIIITLACILIAAVIALVLVLTLKLKDKSAEQNTDTAETEISETENTEFTPGENDKIIEAVDDLGYCVLTMRYYFNEEGILYRVSHTAEYVDETQAKMDYAVIESMGEFSEYSMEDNVIKSVLTPEGIERNYPDATPESIIEYVTSKDMKYEIVQ